MNYIKKENTKQNPEESHYILTKGLNQIYFGEIWIKMSSHCYVACYLELCLNTRRGQRFEWKHFMWSFATPTHKDFMYVGKVKEGETI